MTADRTEEPTMSTATATRRVKSISYETATCGRCCGTGRMPFAVYGGVCFGCEGKGDKVTAAGKRARAKVEAYGDLHLTVPASQVKPGDRIKGTDGKFRTVVEVETHLGDPTAHGRSAEIGWGKSKVGDAVSMTLGQTLLSTKTGGYQGPAHRSVRLAWTSEHLAAAAELVAHLKGATVTYHEDW